MRSRQRGATFLGMMTIIAILGFGLYGVIRLTPKYLEQARRTLKRGYDRDERDPRLLAVLGLCEIDAGNDAG